MKRARAFRKLQLRGIRATITRFLSILVIVCVGAGFLSGLLATMPDMQNTTDKYYDDNNVYDVDIRGTLGLTDADVGALDALDCVSAVMPAYVLDLELESGDESYVTRLYGLPLDRVGDADFLNGFTLTSGRLPNNSGECLICSPNGYYLDQSTGGAYVISEDNDGLEQIRDMVDFDSLTAVGVISTPLYMSVESELSTVGAGKIELVIFAFSDVFTSEAYTDIFLTVNGAAPLNAFFDGYETLVGDAEDALKTLGAARSQIRYDDVVREAGQTLSDSEAEYEKAKADAEQTLSDARAELDDGWSRLADAKQALDSAKDAYDSGAAQLAGADAALTARIKDEKTRGEAQIEAGITAQRAMLYAQIEAQRVLQQAQIDAQRQAVEQAYAAGAITAEEYAAGIAAADAAKTQLDAQIADAQQQTEASLASAELQANQTLAQQLDAAQQQGEQQIAASRSKLKKAEQEIADAEREIADSEQALLDGEQEYADAKKTSDGALADAYQELEQGRQALADIELPQWYLFDRDDLTSFSSYKSNSGKLDAIAKVFPIFLFFVAALVSLTTMTRMVEEERGQIGMLKALGYANGRIMAYYVGYAVLASLAGSMIGVVLGSKTLPLVISNAYGMMYAVPRVITGFYWDNAIGITLISVVCNTGATLLACVSQLAEKPAQLMRPRAPKAGKRVLLERIRFLWQRLSFTHKVTVRNIFRYKKRLYMTVFGIAGCCALLVTAFGLRDSIHSIVDKQFGEIYRYDLTLYLSGEDADGEDGQLHSVLTDPQYVKDYTAVHLESCSALSDTGKESVYVYVPKEQAQFTDYIALRDRRSGEAVAFSEDSVVLTEKLCEELGLSVGDPVTIDNGNGKSAELTVTGIAENYIFGNVYLSASTYERAFGETPAYATLLVNVTADDATARDALSTLLLRGDSVLSLRFAQAIRESFENTVKSIDYIVYVLMIAAGVLAVIVMYNLTNINICERRKELATLKVLGFYDKEVAGYIYRETSVLCLIGILLGFAFGKWLHLFVIRTAEVDSVMFGRGLYFSSFAAAAAVTVFFTVLVDIVMIREIKKISMTESMTANE